MSLAPSAALANCCGSFPQNAGVHYLMARALRADGDVAGYKSELRRTLELNPDDVRAKIDLAAVTLQEGDVADGSALVGELKEAAP